MTIFNRTLLTFQDIFQNRNCEFHQLMFGNSALVHYALHPYTDYFCSNEQFKIEQERRCNKGSAPKPPTEGYEPTKRADGVSKILQKSVC